MLFIDFLCNRVLFSICMFVDVHVVYFCGSLTTERERQEETRHSDRVENGMDFDR